MPRLYSNLSKLPFLRMHYSGKFLFVAFIGIHIPLIVIVLITVTGIFSFTKETMLTACLLATLAASALTLYFLNRLLWPLHRAKSALDRYLTHQELPDLPTHFEDEAGILLKQLQQTLEQQNQLLDEKKDTIHLLSHNVQLPFEQFSQLSTQIIQETDLEKLHDHGRTIKEISVKNLLTLHQVLSYLNAKKY
jgi:methyl-accepting chemotaxis protein